MRYDKSVEVKSCRNACPFFSAEGMEHLMMCNHPHFTKGKDPYAGAIITQSNSNGRVPDKCPLRKGPVMTTLTVFLKA